MSTENIVTGKFYRILKDATNDVWDRISFWTHADDVQTASGITLTNDLSAKDSKITTTQSDFATIESSSVSAHAYVIGNMLVYNNQLYRVTSAIAVGATLVPGTNIEAVSVGTLSNMLNTSDGKGFYFDQKDGSYGFYPTALKQASEFVPFGGTITTCAFTTSSPGEGNANSVLCVYNPETGQHVTNLLSSSYNSPVLDGGICTVQRLAYGSGGHQVTVVAKKDGTLHLGSSSWAMSNGQSRTIAMSGYAKYGYIASGWFE